MKIQLPSVRIAFPNLFVAKAGQDGGEPKYGAAFILDPKAGYIKEIEAAIAAEAKAKWGEKAAGIVKNLTENGKVCFKKGPRTKADGEPYEGFEGMYSINATNKARPTVVGRDLAPLTAADGKPYGGCYVNASLDIWVQDNQYGKRINASLRGVQFVKDGDSFGGTSVAAADEFQALEVDGEDLVG